MVRTNWFVVTFDILHIPVSYTPGQRTCSLLFNVPVASCFQGQFAILSWTFCILVCDSTSLILFQGGLSKRYKTTFLVENANEGESKASLFRVQGTSSRSMQAIQVDLVGSLVLSAILLCHKIPFGSIIYVFGSTACRQQPPWTHPTVTFYKMKLLSSLGLGNLPQSLTMMFLTECYISLM